MKPATEKDKKGKHAASLLEKKGKNLEKEGM